MTGESLSGMIYVVLHTFMFFKPHDLIILQNKVERQSSYCYYGVQIL